jgi:hypothetical protein
MEQKQIEAIKSTIKLQIDRGDFTTLSKIFNTTNNTARARYRRNNEKAVLCMQEIINSKNKITQKLKKKYQIK